MLATIKRTRPTIIFGVPTIWVAMNNQVSAAEAPDLSHLSACVSGGAFAIGRATGFEKLTGAIITEGYGLSEASPIITCNPINGRIKDNSCGPAFPATVIEIRNPETGELLPTGERGEVCARGPQVMPDTGTAPKTPPKPLSMARCAPATSAIWMMKAISSLSTG
jgi:long-chain acyl-CoA synthetase